jgi:predicted RNA methylase
MCALTSSVLAWRVHMKLESQVHPHCTAEQAHLFSSVDGGSAELEVLSFLSALVSLFKPTIVLETGTGKGYTSLAIADALKTNGRGHLHTVEFDPSTVAVAKQNLEQVAPELKAWITHHTGDTREFISSWSGPPFDFALFDSDLQIRHIEFEMLLCASEISEDPEIPSHGNLARGAVCCFHDTSRFRGETMHDFNPEMIAALDRHSQGQQWLECPYSRGFRVLRLP